MSCIYDDSEIILGMSAGWYGRGGRRKWRLMRLNDGIEKLNNNENSFTFAAQTSWHSSCCKKIMPQSNDGDKEFQFLCVMFFPFFSDFGMDVEC